MRLLEMIPVSSARAAVGVSPRSVIIETDERFNAVDQILFNGIASPSYAVYKDTALIAQVPDGFDDEIITDITVLSSLARMQSSSLIELGLGGRVGVQTGPQRLIQNFVRLLLRTTGSNLFHKELGGSLSASIGANVTMRTKADVAVAVSDVKRQILAAQSPYSNIPANERLLSAEITGVTEDPQSASIYCTVVLTTHDRQRSGATLVA